MLLTNIGKCMAQAKKVLQQICNFYELFLLVAFSVVRSSKHVVQHVEESGHHVSCHLASKHVNMNLHFGIDCKNLKSHSTYRNIRKEQVETMLIAKTNTRCKFFST